MTIGQHVHSFLDIKAPQRFTLYFGSLNKSMVTPMKSILMLIIPVDIGLSKVLCKEEAIINPDIIRLEMAGFT